MVGNQASIHNLDLDPADNPSPLRCLKTLVTDALCDYIITSINDFANLQVQKNTPTQKRSRYATWVPITKHEFLKFLAVLTNMGIDKRAAVRDYFSSTPNQFTLWYHQMFDRECFEVIYHTTLHVGEPDATGKSKVEPFMNRLIDSYNNAFTPYQEVSIDEMIIGWKGRWKYKQYNASKPHKYHIKSFGLVDSATGCLEPANILWSRNVLRSKSRRGQPWIKLCENHGHASETN